ncbi:uncharacterized protein LOC106669419 [Cimex lectularius]|uniref:Tudor domain-containing protein n=1 Tax=Cimex lectularius TaxID=79782 RepID=A0A8I6RZ99_CIMLE|nr:uncharacterized protein LOC106669419 [Cimex lectularius]
MASKTEQLALLSSSLSDINELFFKCIQGFTSTQKKLEHVLAMIDESESTPLTPVELVSIKEVMDLYITRFSPCENLVEQFDEKLDLLLELLPPSLVWLSTNEPVQMKYMDGKSPWEFQLQHYPNRTNEIQKMLLHIFEMSQMKPVQSPKVGDTVCVQENGTFFRAAILQLGSNDKVSLINVDKGYKRIAKMNQLYELPTAVLEIPAQNVLCSLLPEDPEGISLWDESLQQHFQAIISECVLKVEKFEEFSEYFPPRFRIQAIGYNETLTYTANFNIWLIDRLLPEIKKKHRLGEETSVAYLDELNPFEELSCESNSPSKKALDLDFKNEVLNSRQHNNITLDAQEIVPYSEKQITPIDISNQRVENNLNPAVSTLFKETPHAHAAIVLPEMNEAEEALTITNLADEYQPEDETRLCQIYQKKKSCFKINCRKVHKLSSGKWTDDRTETYCDLFNKINLPDVFQEIPVKILSVVSGHLFYVALHSKYSDIGEQTSKVETLFDLENDMNNPENVKSYQYFRTDPSLGELVIAKDSKGCFRRGRVVDFYEFMANVFFVDFGFHEDIAISDLYLMLPQYLHLPAQAVFTSLSGVTTVDAQEGRAFLENLIQGKILSARIVSRNLTESELEVKLYTSDRLCINKMVIDSGYCKEF